ncbi:MAG TPA: tryptophan synthase subunit alpha [Micromonosporaceae bacterium]|jgi:tryptophan synthase alpha chain|nr:tryptophan synthase subunit alpha [Micromonosporaceae bacterium]
MTGDTVTSDATQAGRLSAVFETARAQQRALLVGCLPAGFPTVARGIDAMRAMTDAGADVIEMELAYSDPVIDGPVIQRASEIALAGGVRTADVFRSVEAVAGAGATVILMTYWNPVERYGVDRFARDFAAAGGSGIVTPDLIPDEAAEWIAAADRHDLDRIFLVAPSSTPARIAATVAACRGFVYATSVMGVTGARDHTSDAAPGLVARVRSATSMPVGVGLGVRDGAQAAAVAGYADAVIVGSALVSCVLDNLDDEAAGRAALTRLTAELAEGVRKR